MTADAGAPGDAAAGRVSLVLGATGLVGRELVRQLCVRGAAVIAHVRPDSPELDRWRARLAELGAEVDATPWDAAALAATLRDRGVDQVYILVGTTRARARSENIAGDIYQAIDVGLVQIAVDAARASGAGPRLVYLSSVGAATGARSSYLRARAASEALVRDAGLPWVIARPSFIVGDRDAPRRAERAAAAASDAVLALAGVLGGRSLRARYRSTSPDVLASALIRLAEAPEHDRIAEGGDLR